MAWYNHPNVELMVQQWKRDLKRIGYVIAFCLTVLFVVVGYIAIVDFDGLANHISASFSQAIHD